MAFKGLRFAGLEWSNLAASKVMWVVIGAIAIIPLLYGALYLAAFQDPYGRLDSLPVAVVNEDEGAVIAAENRNLGDDVVDDLKRTDNGLGWHFVSADEARAGLKDGTYFMTCTIPSDFSASAASVDGDAPRRAQLKVTYNESENMLASQIGQTVWKEVRKQVSDTVAAEYWTTVLSRVAASGREIRTAAGGAADLERGLATAQEGGLTIATGLGVLDDGALALERGLNVLANGALELSSKGGRLASGANDLASGTAALERGADALVAGTAGNSALGSGASDLSAGLNALEAGTVGLPGETKKLRDGVADLVGSLRGALDGDGTAANPGLVAGSQDVAAGVAALADDAAGLPAASRGVSSAARASGDLSDALAGLQAQAQEAARSGDQAAMEAALDEIGTALGTAGREADSIRIGLDAVEGSTQSGSGLAAAAASIGALSSGASDVSGGLARIQQSLSADDPAVDGSVAQLLRGMDALVASSQELADGIGAAATGADRVRGGVREANAGASSLSQGAATAAAGASELADGASAAVDGAGRLALGAQSADEGSARLASGAGQLQEGSSVLVTGLSDAVDGSGELAAKLSEGADEAARQTTGIPAKAAAMSDPVELANDYYTFVENYGTGFAPYFMALGLWVGALVAGFVFKPLNGRLLLAGANPVSAAFANYLPMAVFSLIQATLLMVVLQYGLQLQIDNVPAFYAVGYLTSLVFAAIMQLLMAAFGFPGRFLAIILLMLQLTTCAGTFPIQTTPGFFQAVNPYLPMTYVVEAMRQIMTGLDYGVVAFACLVLAGFGAACFALTSMVAWRKRTVRMDDLHPVLRLG